MKTLLTTTVFALLSAAVVAQNRSDSTQNSKPLVNEQTREKVNEKVEQTQEKISEEVDRSRSYQQDNQLSWFRQGTVFAGGGLGIGGGNKSTYLAVNTRLGYFFQPGFMAGLRFDYDRRVGNKYHARQSGLFARYYPFRTRISSFIGAGYNFGREFSTDLAQERKANYNSIHLEIGVMAWILRRLGAELALENNYYDKLDPAAGRSKGGRFKFGVNYYFGQVGQGARQPSRRR